MIEKLKQWIIDNNLDEGMTLQMYLWSESDPVKKTEEFIVIQPNGGGTPDLGLGSDKYALISIIGSRSRYKSAIEKANRLYEFILNNPLDSCLTYIENMSSIPQPVFTEEGRIVFRMPVRIVSGN